MDQPKIERLLRLMQYLIGNTNYTLEEIGNRLGISRRTLFRYLDTFKSAGFVVRRIGEGRYRIAVSESSKVDLSKIVYFTEEEAYVVNRLIDALDDTNAMKQGLKRKLAAVYDSTSVVDYIDNKENSNNIRDLANAIRNKRSVMLKNYSSSHSGVTKDYYVEPFRFNTNYIDFWAYDLSDGINKRFKVARIGSVEFLDFNWRNEDKHEYEPMDAFRIHGFVPTHVKISLSYVAKNLLVEEYPMAESGLSKDGDGHWIWEGDVNGMDGVGRFVFGLPKQVEVLEGEELKTFLLENAHYILKHYMCLDDQ